jgi:alpha-glucosidase
MLDEHGTGFTVAEVGGDDSDREMKLFTGGNGRLNSAYGFDFLYADRLTPDLIVDAVGNWPDTPGLGWPSWAFENHDAPRAISRWTTPDRREAFARMKILLLVALRGNIFLYQGEELGLTQVDIAFADLLDPEAIANWPLTLSRDGARTPMPWIGAAADLGFGSTRPWLPFGEDHRAIAVDVQEADATSLLHWTRTLIAARKAHHALRTGSLRIVHSDDAVIAFERICDDEALLCAFNLGEQPRDWPIGIATYGDCLFATEGADTTSLPPLSGLVLRR